MERKTKILTVLLTATIVCTLLVSYVRFFVLRDFMIETSQECNPLENTCFVYICDPAHDTDCSGDVNIDTSYFEVIQKPAQEVELCNPLKESCSEITCGPEDANCRVIYCTEALLETHGASRCSNESDQMPETESEASEPGVEETE